VKRTLCWGSDLDFLGGADRKIRRRGARQRTRAGACPGLCGSGCGVTVYLTSAPVRSRPSTPPISSATGRQAMRRHGRSCAPRELGPSAGRHQATGGRRSWHPAGPFGRLECLASIKRHHRLRGDHAAARSRNRQPCADCRPCTAPTTNIGQSWPAKARPAPRLSAGPSSPAEAWRIRAVASADALSLAGEHDHLRSPQACATDAGIAERCVIPQQISWLSALT
jgi:hypothetical protein